MVRAAICIAAGLVLLSAEAVLAQQTAAESKKMEMDHIHLSVKDIAASVAWFEKILQWKPTYQDERIAVLTLKPMTIILDKSPTDASATLSFRSDDVDREHGRLVSLGAVSLEAPNDKPYGVRSAYIKGPGSLKIELEGPLKKPR